MSYDPICANQIHVARSNEMELDVAKRLEVETMVSIAYLHEHFDERDY